MRISMTLHDADAWRPTKSYTNGAAPNTRAKMRPSVTRHDNDAWRFTDRCTDATMPDARSHLSIWIICGDDDVWQATVSYTKATEPDVEPKLHENERNFARCNDENYISMNTKTRLTLYS